MTLWAPCMHVPCICHYHMLRPCPSGLGSTAGLFDSQMTAAPVKPCAKMPFNLCGWETEGVEVNQVPRRSLMMDLCGECKCAGQDCVGHTQQTAVSLQFGHELHFREGRAQLRLESTTTHAAQTGGGSLCDVMLVAAVALAWKTGPFSRDSNSQDHTLGQPWSLPRNKKNIPKSRN